MMPKTLSPGMTHKDVIKAKRLLVKWLRKHKHDRVAKGINTKSALYGSGMRRGVRVFQTQNRLEVDNIVGVKTWERLRARPKRLSKRGKMLAWMTWALNHEASWHYRQSRPMPLTRMKRMQLPITTDCSGSSTGCHYYAGAKDPNGLGYNGLGYTGTIRNHCPRIRLADAKVGDLIIYGGGTGVHMVVVYKEHPTDPLCFSHGQESGPRLYRHSVQVAVHGKYFTVHRALV